MEKITGTVKSMRKDKTAVCLTVDGQDEWFDLDSRVKPEYISISPFEASVEDQGEGKNRLVTFIKCSKNGNTNTTNTNSQPIQQANDYDASIRRMSAVKASSLVYQGSGQENEFKRLSDEIVKYIEEGVWVVRP